MNKVVLAVVVVLVLGGYFFYTSRTNTSLETTEKTEQSQTNTPEDTDFTGTLAAAVQLGVPLKCTYTDGETSGEGYLKGKNYRGSMRTTDGETTEILMKESCMWTWSNKNPGMTMCYDPTEAQVKLWQDIAQEPTTTQSTEPSTPENEGQYSCKPAIVSDTMFEPPSDVSFTDLSQMMQPGAIPDMSDFQDLIPQQ